MLLFVEKQFNIWSRNDGKSLKLEGGLKRFFGTFSTLPIAKPNWSFRLLRGKKSWKIRPKLMKKLVRGCAWRWRVETPATTPHKGDKITFKFPSSASFEHSFPCSTSSRCRARWLNAIQFIFSTRLRGTSTSPSQLLPHSMFPDTIWLWNESNDLDQSLLTYLFSFKLAETLAFLSFPSVTQQQLRFLI